MRKNITVGALVVLVLAASTSAFAAGDRQLDKVVKDFQKWNKQVQKDGKCEPLVPEKLHEAALEAREGDLDSSDFKLAYEVSCDYSIAIATSVYWPGFQRGSFIQRFNDARESERLNKPMPLVPLHDYPNNDGSSGAAK